MTIEEYMGHLNDRLMLELSNMSEMPEMEDWVVFQIVEKAVQLMKDDYMLVHKSHIVIQQEYDMSKTGHLTRAMVIVYVTDIAPDVEMFYSKLSEKELLKQHEDWVLTKLFMYLEQPAPSPVQTQPDQP
jgi:hypothetical protein